MYGIQDGGTMAIRFGETSPGLSGNKMAGNPVADSYITQCRKRAGNNLAQLAQGSGKDINTVVRMVLNQSRPELENYIRSKGETPVSTLDGVIVQAALLRADDIATVSNATGLNDNESLQSIEQGESEAVLNGTSDADDVLPPDTMAALNVVINYFSGLMHNQTGANSLAEAMQAAKGSVATPLNSTSSFQGFNMGELVRMNSYAKRRNRADGEDDDSEDDIPDLASPTSGLANTGGISLGNIQVAPPSLPVATASGSSILNPVLLPTTAPTLQLSPTALAGAAAAQASQGAVNSSSTTPQWTGLLSNIANTAQALQHAITGTANVVSGTVNNLGAGSISTWINQNMTFLLIAALAIVLIIIIIARAGRNK